MKNYLLKKIYSIAFYPFSFVLVLWLVYFAERSGAYHWTTYGILPRQFSGLKGVVLSVFLHGDFDHLVSNTLPILVLGMLLFFFYKIIARQVFLWIWLISGLWLWIGGRNNDYYPVYHIGASTLIYGLATFLFFSGVFRKHLPLMVVSALVVFLYGSIMWGIFPLKPEMSWEGHLFGAIAGLMVAFNYRNEGPKKRKFEWEEDDEDDDGGGLKEGEPTSAEITYHYIYKEKE